MSFAATQLAPDLLNDGNFRLRYELRTLPTTFALYCALAIGLTLNNLKVFCIGLIIARLIGTLALAHSGTAGALRLLRRHHPLTLLASPFILFFQFRWLGIAGLVGALFVGYIMALWPMKYVYSMKKM